MIFEIENSTQRLWRNDFAGLFFISADLWLERLYSEEGAEIWLPAARGVFTGGAILDVLAAVLIPADALQGFDQAVYFSPGIV
jgi:hypothetical protein